KLTLLRHCCSTLCGGDLGWRAHGAGWHAGAQEEREQQSDREDSREAHEAHGISLVRHGHQCAMIADHPAGPRSCPMSSVQPGCLWVVATPIGHRDDLSARAIESLRAVAVIAAEDTRHSRPLLA